MRLFVLCFVLCMARLVEMGGYYQRKTSKQITSTEKATSQMPSSVSTVAYAECLQQTHWVSNCFDCRCNDHGVAECDKLSNCNSDKAEPVRCKVNTTFRRDCNMCTCLGDGLGLCTLNKCTEPDKVPQQALPQGKECAAGSSWKSECNQCTCSPQGVAFCTEKGCVGAQTNSRSSCAPDSVWMDDCNTCQCIDGKALCTRMGCQGLPGELNFDDDDVVTPAAAVTSPPVLEQPKIVCSANRMFVKDCNTCWCNENGTAYFCTRKICLPNITDEANEEDVKQELRVVVSKCKPFEAFEVDCNMCRCNADGLSYSCTRRACFNEPPKTPNRFRKARAAPNQEPPKTCQPGHEFRMDCNMCLCDNEGQDFSCTRIDCASLNNNNNGATRRKRGVGKQAIKKCEPGDVFEQGCNVCRCTSDGRHATCTLKRCSLDATRGEDNASTDSTFRCNPGEQFRRDCNDCTCSADGRSVFCTLRLCDLDTDKIIVDA